VLRQRSAASAIGAEVSSIQTSPTFVRRLVTRGSESVVVDLAYDGAPQSSVHKRVVGGVIVDSPAEILANKLCTLLSRCEVRDLVDTRALLATGLSFDDALKLAMVKDGGLSPAQLGWALSQFVITDDSRVPGGIDTVELKKFKEDLQQRLAAAARPSPS
jgi:hypothetical protein